MLPTCDAIVFATIKGAAGLVLAAPKVVYHIVKPIVTGTYGIAKAVGTVAAVATGLAFKVPYELTKAVLGVSRKKSLLDTIKNQLNKNDLLKSRLGAARARSGYIRHRRK